MKEKIESLKRKFNNDLQNYIKSGLLDNLYLEYLGKKGAINSLLSQIPNLLEEDKKIIGPKINELKVFIEREINKARAVSEKQKDLEWVDFTVPGNKTKTGHYHPTTLTIRELNNFFRYYGYSVAEGPEIETDEYNFEKLNLPKDHPARDLQDSLYIKEPDILLRTHSSSVETRVMTSTKPPIRIVVPGKCYRNESTNKSNSAIFYQYEGLAIDKDINMTNLKFTLEEMAKFLYGNDVKTRFRCKYYPQVEPGVGLDIKCTFCKGSGCSVCKYIGWIELLGAGMVHPKALESCGINHKIYSGFAFGIGLDRIVMTKFNISDIRFLYSGVMVYV